MSGARKAWIVAASIGPVEALKDQLGFCRWNYALRSIQQHAKINLRSYCQAQILSGSSSSTRSAISNKMREEKAKRTEEKLRKVMEVDCWGPKPFNGRNDFNLWQQRVKNILTRECLMKTPKKKSEEQEGMENDEWEEIRELANSTIELYPGSTTLRGQKNI
ncbi:hypothetical protein Vadar_004706 [Vaccinium darrowii]|uniref:Uncharacterized protein n=1 Tax=Vaccinium darrowii TaxID=229202 RepID=A0ACB7Z455_9ERIC|nr:hypothetical protein Vadar_004706 [Vaccinium darrowii]